MADLEGNGLLDLLYSLYFGMPKINCKKHYIWSAGRQMTLCLGDHRRYILNQVTSRETGAHWNLPDQSLADLQVTILEQCKKNSEEYRIQRAKFVIRKFDTYKNALA